MADEKKVLDYNGLLYYHTGLKGLFLSDVSYDSTNAKITKTKNGQTTDVVTATTLKTAMSLNNVGNFKAVSTVANQGLTEEEKANARSNIGAGSSGFSGSFTDLTDVPTTIAGYGITDAGISSGTITLGANTITPLTSSDVTSTYSSSGTAPVNGTAVASAISGKADSATTLAGYGITDAKITSGTITLGANSFKGVSVAANQGLTSTEKSNARANIGAGTSSFDGAFSSLSGTPTTIAGYGITDAKIVSGTITLGANTITPLTSSDVTSTYSSSGTAPVNGTAVASAISGKADSATTLAGYGITDAKITSGTITLGANSFKGVSVAANQGLTSTEKSNARANIGAGTSSFDGAFSSLSGKPTTIAGYGITDAKIASGTITLGSSTITPLTSSDVTSSYSSTGTAAVNGTAVASAISGKADSATTLAGYGITDAGISSGTITLGSNTFKGVSVAANQGLTSTEQENARANLGITLTEIYKFKGSVATVSALDNITTKAVGDVYNVTANGVNYAWTGTVWDALGGEFEITSISNSEIDAILNGTASSS